MTPIQQSHVLVCPHCKHKTALPPRNREGKSPSQYYWPTGSDTLNLLCNVCRKWSVHSQQKVHPSLVESEGLGAPPSVFVKITFLCGQDNCGLPFSLHIRTEAQTTEDELTAWGQSAISTAVCSASHSLGQNLTVLSIVKIQ
jgi:uncharacterized protein YbaR (Trm112 family)